MSARFAQSFGATILFAGLVAVSAFSLATADTVNDGVTKVASGYGFDETIARLKQDIARKGIKAVLDDPESTTSERLKAIDLALKLTMGPEPCWSTRVMG